MRFIMLSLFWILGSALKTAPSSPQKSESKTQLRCAAESKKQFQRGAVRIGGDIKPPKKLVDAQLRFPELPPGTRISSGFWLGEALVAADGSIAAAWAVREPRLDPPFPDFNEAILEAIKKWEYEPVIVAGEKTPFCIVVSVNIDFQ
jgi:hypothetical protein